jgi:hypothetical protein
MIWRRYERKAESRMLFGFWRADLGTGKVQKV